MNADNKNKECVDTESLKECVNNIDIAKEVVRNFEINTGTKYATYRKKAGFCTPDFDLKGHKLLFEDKKSAAQQIKFDGVPFFINSMQEMDCVNGKDLNLSQKKKRKKCSEGKSDHSFKKTRFLAQDTKKMDCPAKIIMRDVIYFPQYKIDSNTEWKRKNATSKLTKAWETDRSKVNVERKVWISHHNEHEGHLIGGEVGGMSQPVDERLIKKIYELVGEGVCQGSEMERHLKIFVKNELFKGTSLPNFTNRRFYPLMSDIRSHMYHAAVRHRLAKMDQENLALKLEKWKLDYPSDSFFYRPYGSHVEGDVPEENVSNEEDDNDEIEVKDLNTESKLLFIHQSAYQKKN